MSAGPLTSRVRWKVPSRAANAGIARQLRIARLRTATRLVRWVIGCLLSRSSLIDLNIARAGVHSYQLASPAQRAFQGVTGSIQISLDCDGNRPLDAQFARIRRGIQLEGGVGGEAYMNIARAGTDLPGSRRLTSGADVTARGLEIESSIDSRGLDVAGGGVNIDIAFAALLELNVTTGGLGAERAGDRRCPHVTRPAACPNSPGDVFEPKVSRAAFEIKLAG